MKKQMRFILLFILCFSLLVSIMPVYAADNDSHITVTLNGKPLDFDVMPQIIDNRTMVPMRTIFEAMGATVDWDENTQTITAMKGSTKVVMQIQKSDMKVNDQTILLDAFPQIINSRTFVPIRAVAESFDAKVLWDSEKQAVAITTSDQTVSDAESSTDVSVLTNENIESGANPPYALAEVGDDNLYFFATDSKWTITIPKVLYLGNSTIRNGGRVFRNDDTFDDVLIKISMLSNAKNTLEDLTKASMDEDINSMPIGVTCSIEKNVTKETIDNMDFDTYTLVSNQKEISIGIYQYTYFAMYDGLLFEFSSSTPSQTVIDEFRYILTSFADSTQTLK